MINILIYYSYLTTATTVTWLPDICTRPSWTPFAELSWTSARITFWAEGCTRASPGWACATWWCAPARLLSDNARASRDCTPRDACARWDWLYIIFIFECNARLSVYEKPSKLRLSRKGLNNYLQSSTKIKPQCLPSWDSSECLHL